MATYCYYKVGVMYMTIADRIKQRRIELNMSQQELAEKVGYKTRSAINKIELGHRDIRQKQIQAFAEALKTTTEYLMSGVSSANISPTIPDEDLKFALWGGDADEITDEMLDDVKRYAEFIRSKKNEND